MPSPQVVQAAQKLATGDARAAQWQSGCGHEETALSRSGSVPASSGTRGDWILLACAFAAYSASAAVLHAYTVFLVAFIDEFRWSRADTSLGYAVSQLVSGVSAPRSASWSIASARAA